MAYLRAWSPSLYALCLYGFYVYCVCMVIAMKRQKKFMLANFFSLFFLFYSARGIFVTPITCFHFLVTIVSPSLFHTMDLEWVADLFIYLILYNINNIFYLFVSPFSLYSFYHFGRCLGYGVKRTVSTLSHLGYTRTAVIRDIHLNIKLRMTGNFSYNLQTNAMMDITSARSLRIHHWCLSSI